MPTQQLVNSQGQKRRTQATAASGAASESAVADPAGASADPAAGEEAASSETSQQSKLSFSPIVDPEGDDIEVALSGYDQVPYLKAWYEQTQSQVVLEFLEGLVTYENTATVDFVITLTDPVSVLNSEYTIPITITKKPPIIRKKQVIALVVEAVKTVEEIQMAREGVIDYDRQEVEQVMAKAIVKPVEVQKNEFGFVQPRKNQPVARVVYTLPEDMFQREEPTIKKLAIGKVGDLRLDFS